jgi:transposase InsO family protein
MISLPSHQYSPINSVLTASAARVRAAPISWVFSQKVTEAGLAPSVGAVGAPFDNAMVEAFWARMQVELLNRRKWKTRVELAMLTPTEFENYHQQQQQIVA